jgi:dolichol-phosphate hexosyltransferase
LDIFHNKHKGHPHQNCIQLGTIAALVTSFITCFAINPNSCQSKNERRRKYVPEDTLNPYSIQVVIAALNEEVGIEPTIMEFVEDLHIRNILVVDGCSTDRTVEIAKNMGAQIAFQDGAGKGNAIAKALQHLNPDTQYVVLTDADYTYPAEYVPEMIHILQQNPNVGMVCGNRFSQPTEPKAQRTSFYLGNKLLAFAHNLLNGITLNDPLTGLRVIRAELLNTWKVKSDGFDIEVELNHYIEKKGYKIVEIPITYRKRLGEKKLKMRHGATILKRILAETGRYLKTEETMKPNSLTPIETQNLKKTGHMKSQEEP